MKTLLLTIIVCLATTLACAQQTDEEGFISLFDGKSLKGWKATSENPGSFEVKDGILIAQGGRAHLFYSGSVGNADFKNFELKVRVRTTANSNSGVYFHTQYQETGWPNAGFEAQVNSTHSDPRKTGSLYGIVNMYVPPADEKPYHVKVAKSGEVFVAQAHAPSIDDEWYDYHIIVQDQTITLKINGKITVEWTQPEDWDREGRRIGHGTIGFQAHDPKSVTHYKDIRIKMLD